MKLLRRVIPIVISIVLLVILAGYAPWAKVGVALEKLNLATILLLLALSVLYYALKALRFWYLLKTMKIEQPFGIVALSYISAQPVTLLPAGEIFRSRQLERYTGVPMRKSVPQFTMQALLEGAGMAILGIISALALGTLRVPVLSLALVVALGIIAIQQGYLTNFLRVINAIPFVNLTHKHLHDFNESNRAMLTRRWLPGLMALSLATELLGAAIAYVSVTGLGGHITIFEAMLVYIIPILVGFLSFLPGGIGAAEHSAIGVLLLSDVTIGIAVAATLVMRVSIVLTGVIYGLIAMAIARAKYPLKV